MYEIQRVKRWPWRKVYIELSTRKKPGKYSTGRRPSVPTKYKHMLHLHMFWQSTSADREIYE